VPLHKVLAAWDCPHIVQSLGSMADSSRLYLFLEFMRGGDLFTLLVQEGCLPLAVARFFASEVLVALTFIHDRHHVYRDLKPENVLLEESGHLKLADMGFCKQLMIGERTYTTCGTHDYMAPEARVRRPELGGGR
jgi:serine/threonine protein kinase